MGKPFTKEIDLLEATYSWASGVDVTAMAEIIKDSWSLPLISVGSGGSFSASELQAHLHRTFFSSLSQAVTPVEMLTALPKNREAAVWFISAGGNNIDICRAFQHASLHELRYVNVLVGSRKTKLHKLFEKYQSANIWGFPLPSGKDGFLATNSLLAFSVILYRAYLEAIQKKSPLPLSLKHLFKKTLKGAKNLPSIQKLVEPLWNCAALHVVYSPQLKSTALDIESKFVEAGLMSVHLADIRNFAHGRHHWFAKNTESSGIIFLSTENDESLAVKTLKLLPNEIPKVNISFKTSNGLEGVSGVVLSLYFALWLGTRRGIDPGRPGVPSFGSKIYRLTANPGFVSSINKKEAAINRKKRWLSPDCDLQGNKIWSDAYGNFTKKITSADIGGIVLDYDGTFVDSKKRWDPPTVNIVNELIRLLDHGMSIGFATGRGKSIRTDLQKVIPQKYWKHIVIGYYNGSELRQLADNSVLDGSSKACKPLAQIHKKLEENIFLSTLAEFDPKKFQLTIGRKAALSENFLWDLVQDELYKDKNHQGEVLRSSHSIDIIIDKVSKLTVVEHIKKNIPENKRILTIGDRGKWPGNDALLLKEGLSLSVDEVSYALNRCWNLCPAGVTGVQGAVYYLTRIQGKKGSFRFHV